MQVSKRTRGDVSKNLDVHTRACLDAQARGDIEDRGGIFVKIPMDSTHVRSLNLATSCGIGLYEVRLLHAREQQAVILISTFPDFLDCRSATSRPSCGAHVSTRERTSVEHTHGLGAASRQGMGIDWLADRNRRLSAPL